MTSSNIITAKEAEKLVGKSGVAFVDGSWYLPAQNRNGHEEYNAARIPGAVYFDINAIADQDTDLPHMLPTPTAFESAVRKLGISNDTHIIVYDGPGLFSAARVWWTFKIMGASNVQVLEDGFDNWQHQGRPIETDTPSTPAAGNFTAKFSKERVISMDGVIENLESKSHLVIDARTKARFDGTAPEPRPGMRSGHIPGSKAMPFVDLLEAGRLKPTDELKAIFKKLDITPVTPVITSCGSGVTAAVLTLALEETGHTNNRLFDGSWAQWGMPDGPPVHTNVEKEQSDD